MINSFLKVLMIKTVCAVVTTAFSLLVGDCCFAHETLFYKASRNYDEEGSLGSVYRKELETRMFTHPTWGERLYLNYTNPDIDETLEVYSKSDGSRWLNYRRAVPSLSRMISAYVLGGANLDLKRKLDAVQIFDHEVALPEHVASETRLLWRTMLSGLEKPPPKGTKKAVSVIRTIYLNWVVIIAFAKEDDAVKIGSIPMNLHKTRAYREFGAIVDDLIKASERGAGARDPIWAELRKKMRNLRLHFGRRS